MWRIRAYEYNTIFWFQVTGKPMCTLRWLTCSFSRAPVEQALIYNMLTDVGSGWLFFLTPYIYRATSAIFPRAVFSRPGFFSTLQSLKFFSVGSHLSSPFPAHDNRITLKIGGMIEQASPRAYTNFQVHSSSGCNFVNFRTFEHNFSAFSRSSEEV